MYSILYSDPEGNTVQVTLAGNPLYVTYLSGTFKISPPLNSDPLITITITVTLNDGINKLSSIFTVTP